MSSAGNPTQANVQIVGQYVKDLSFENPGAPTGMTGNPGMDMGVDLKARPVGPDHHEVVFHLRVKATSEDRTLFMLELAYGALVKLTNVPEEVVQQLLLIQVPHLMFPFARRVVADVVRDGGMPPLIIEPIDFASLYQSRMAQATSQPLGSA